MPFEEALAKLCQATWPAESDDEKAAETSKTSVAIDRKKKRHDKPG